MHIDKQHLRKEIPYMVAILYAVLMTAAAVTTGNSIFTLINTYVTDIAALWAAIYLMTRAIRERDGKEVLYSALGMSCLTLGNLYFILLDIVSFHYDVIAVGLFAKVCCYLFFIAVLSAQKPYNIRRAAFVDIGSFVVSASCAYAVITNSYLIINLSVILLNILCAVFAAGLFKSPDRVRFFAQVMMFLAIKDILSVFSILSFPTDTLSPLLYLLIVFSSIRMKEVVYAE